MNRSRLIISIPKPCSENWHTMLPDAQGRFCQSCQKSVIDFTGMRDEEVQQIFSKEKGPVCGRFKSSQLVASEKLENKAAASARWKSYLLAFSSIIGLKVTLANEVKAQIPSEQREPEYKRQFSEPSAELATNRNGNPTLIISGKVIDANDSLPLPGIAIVFKGSTNGTTTNAEGRYSLMVDQSSPVTLIFAYIGYATKEIAIVEGKNRYDIGMVADEQGLTEVLYVGTATAHETCLKKKYSLSQTYIF